MNPIVRNILAVIAGLIIGSIINMGIVILGGSAIAPPDGVNVTDPESIKSGMHLFEFNHFIFPFLAHAIGTLAGAYFTTRIAVSHHLRLALVIGVFFLIGGIMNIYQIGSPVAFTIIDLVFAYIPMAWLGWRLAKK